MKFFYLIFIESYFYIFLLHGLKLNKTRHKTATLLGRKFQRNLLLNFDTLLLKPLNEQQNSLPEILQDKIPFNRRKEANQMYRAVYDQFDHIGYNSLIKSVMSTAGQQRFTQALARLSSILPHCDRSSPLPALQAYSPSSKFPGGPLRRQYGFDLTKWITDQIMAVANNAGAANPMLGMMAMMSATSLIGVISTVMAALIDIIPPMLPPPIWIFRPFPCLPMLTGINCLLSVLYPISIADFTIAHVTDQTMNGVFNSFPAKFNSKVGKTSVAIYNLCATIYFGMYCASLFPMCWLPPGVMEAQSFPLCFPQCLLVLVACPGFWLDDILGPCKSVSVPPFCSFSVFINKNFIPPQYTSYEDQHPYPKDCPHFDPMYDTPLGLYNPSLPPSSPIKDAAKEKFILPHPSGNSLFRNVEDFKPMSPIHRVCDCKSLVCTATSPGGCGDSYRNKKNPCFVYCASIKALPNITVSTPKPQLQRVWINISDTPTIHHENEGHVIVV